MSKSTFAIALSFALAAVSPVSAATTLPLRFVTADGAWDCRDATDTHIGTIVVADTTYAFINEGKVAGYGSIRLVDGDFDLPKYTVMTGHLKDNMKVFGLTLRGPRGNEEYVNGEIFLHAVLGFDGKQDWDCTRRGGRANSPPA